MRTFVLGFLIFVALYHVIVTCLSFWAGVVPAPVILVVRDLLWLIWVWTLALTYQRSIRSFLNQRWSVVVLFTVLILLALLTSIFLGADVRHMVVGFKYSLYYCVPFLSALFVWSVWSSKFEHTDIKKWLHTIRKLFVLILIVWRVRQICKNIFPDLMYWFGYGWLGDYVFGKNPPLYYLTGPNGIQRRSGIFSWPNNYGYLLVVFFGLFWYGVRAYIKNRKTKALLRTLYIVTLVATLSRGAMLWVLVQVLLISYVIYHTKRHIIVLAALAGIGAVVGLSVVKRDSTMAHMKAKFNSLQYVQQAPLGYGLGSSGPSVHSQWGYLPENFFIQLMMDLWIHGFVIRGLLWLVTFLIVRRIYAEKMMSRTLLFFVSVWFVGIMVEWLFLHVLEDSMVNYMYFIVRWIVLWYVSGEWKLFKTVPTPRHIDSL